MPHSLIAEHPLLLSPSLAARCGIDEALVLWRLWQWAPTGKLSVSSATLAATLPGTVSDWAAQQLDSLRRKGLLSIADQGAEPLELTLHPWPGDAVTAPPLAVSPALVAMLGAAEACLLSGLDLLAQTRHQQPIEATWDTLGERFPWWEQQQLRQLLLRLRELGVLWLDIDPPPALTLRLSLAPPTAIEARARATPATATAEPLREIALELERQHDIPAKFTLAHGAELSAADEPEHAGERSNHLRRRIIGRWHRQLAAADANAAAAADTDAADGVDHIFHLFARLFPQQFRNAWPNPAALDEVKQLWRMALSEVPPKTLLAAAHAAARQSPYLPALAEVAKRCAAQPTSTLPTEPPPVAWSAREQGENLARLRRLRQSLAAEAPAHARRRAAPATKSS